jgi:hypothetical protein
MRRFLFFVVFFIALLLLTGCKSKQTTLESVQRDSVRVEYRERTVLVPDTVYLEIPAQTAERTTRDSISRLENDFATSEAHVFPDGSLFHNLIAKAQRKAVETTRQIEYRDSIVYRDRVQNVTQTVTKEVAKPLTWWQRTQIYGFWALIAIASLIYIVRVKIVKSLN